MWLAIVAIIKLIGSILKMLSERNKEKKEKQKEAIKEVANGVKKRDPSRITAGFDKLNRM